MSDFDAFLREVRAQVHDIAQDEAAKFAKDLVADAKDFVSESEELLKEWVAKLAAGEMTADGFKLAVRGRADVGQMHLLTQRGLAKIGVDRLKAAVADSIVSAASSTLLP